MGGDLSIWHVTNSSITRFMTSYTSLVIILHERIAFSMLNAAPWQQNQFFDSTGSAPKQTTLYLLLRVFHVCPHETQQHLWQYHRVKDKEHMSSVHVLTLS
jgi:hypothetical protein